MRSLVISVLALGILMGSWAVFVNHATDAIHQMSSIINGDLIPSVAAENWQDAKEQLGKVSALWKEDRLLYSIFFDAISIGDVEGTLAKVSAYIREEETANAEGELEYLNQQLSFLLENEKLSLENAL